MAKLFYEDVFKKLKQKKVRYVIAGDIAINLHGIPRVTADLGLMIALDEENALK